MRIAHRTLIGDRKKSLRTRNLLNCLENLLGVNSQLILLSQNLVADAKRSLAELSELMLNRVVCKYGKSSDEYEMARASHRQIRKHNTRKVTTSEAK